MKTLSDVEPEGKKAGGQRKPERQKTLNKVYCNLSLLRKKSGFSLREVSKHTGVSEACICDAEHGQNCLIMNALKLAKFFETTVEEIWSLKGE